MLSEKIDLCVLKKKKKPWLERMVVGSTGLAVIENFNGNTLVLP